MQLSRKLIKQWLDEWSLGELPLLDSATPEQTARAMREWSLAIKRRDRELHELLSAMHK